VLPIAIEHISRTDRRTVGFSLLPEEDRLVYLGEVQTSPSYALFSYDPDRDLAYRSPRALSGEELTIETQIHFPEQFIAHLGQSPLASALGHEVLIQPAISVATRISPIVAMRALFERFAEVNSALLCAENNALTLLRRAGQELEAHTSARSLEEFLLVSKEAREELFRDFDALDTIVIGRDAVGFDRTQNGGLERLRRIGATDVAAFLSAEWEMDAETLVIDAPAIAAATFVLDVLKTVHAA
jgi:hypothetical protein